MCPTSNHAFITAVWYPHLRNTMVCILPDDIPDNVNHDVVKDTASPQAQAQEGTSSAPELA